MIRSEGDALLPFPQPSNCRALHFRTVRLLGGEPNGQRQCPISESVSQRTCEYRAGPWSSRQPPKPSDYWTCPSSESPISERLLCFSRSVNSEDVALGNDAAYLNLDLFFSEYV